MSTATASAPHQGSTGPLRPLSVALLLGVFVLVISYASLRLSRENGLIAAIWPVNAIALAAIMRRPKSEEWLLLLAMYAGNVAGQVWSGDSMVTAGILSLANIAEVVIASRAFRHFYPDAPPDLSRAQPLITVGITCGLVAPAISASLACLYLFLTQDQTVAADWIIWFLADALGMIAFAPFLLSIQRHEASTLLQAQRAREMLLTVLIATVVTACVFWQSRYPILFLILPVIMLPAFRLGFTATALTSMLVSLIAAVLTILGHGPFTLITGADLQERALILQAFVATTNLMALPAAAALADRRRVISLLDSASHFQQALLNNAAHAIIATDRSGLITLFNSGAERMLGYQAAELVGLHTPEVLHLPEEVATRSAALTQMLKQSIEPGFPTLVAIARANPDQHECTFRRKDGSTLPVALTVTELRDEDGALTGYMGVAKDVTKQHELHELLEQSRRDVLQILNNIPALVGYWDSNLKNRFGNDAYRDWFGIIPTPGEDLRTFLGEEIFQQNRRYIEGVLKGEPQRFERPLTNSKGQRRFGQGNYIPDIQNGEVKGFYVIYFDISDLKEAEDALREARDVAEAATRAKSIFLASMSHELRTPLNAVLGFTDLMLYQGTGSLTQKQTEFLGYVKHSGEHLLNLITDILEFSKIEAGGVSISLEPVDAKLLIRSVIATLRPLAEKANVTLSETGFQNQLPPIAADRTRMAQVLINLGSNAIKYNRPEGWIDFSWERKDDNTMRLLVSDNGWGIPHHRQAELFQAFNRLGAEHGPIEGSGIGLALAKNLMDLMDGEINFTSIEGQGSTFWVDIPLARPSLAPTVRAPAQIAGLPSLPAQLRVVYIEDNESNRVLMRNYLALLPKVELFEADTSEAGLAMVRRQLPDVIFLDINLPGEDGYRILDRLHNEPALRAIPVIGLSAHSLPSERARAMAAGFTDYLGKPARLQDVLAAIARLKKDAA